MPRFVARRLLEAIPTVLGVLAMVFLVIHLIPGDPVSAMLGEGATAPQLAATRHLLGLDRPLPVQFVQFIGRYTEGDLGRSIRTQRPVIDEILSRAAFTVELAVGGILVTVALGVPLGVLAATRRGSLADLVVLVASMAGIAAPVFWIGLLLSLVFATKLGWLPSIGAGRSGDWVSITKALVLPSLTLGLSGMALVARMTRSSMLEVLREDYIRTAFAKGVGNTVVVYRHALKNAAIPIVTIIGTNVGYLLGGAVLTETVFARPGLGKLLVDAILARDYPVVQGVTFFIALLFVVVNLATDMIYSLLDPRVELR